jgi:hypothetical protein
MMVVKHGARAVLAHGNKRHSAIFWIELKSRNKCSKLAETRRVFKMPCNNNELLAALQSAHWASLLQLELASSSSKAAWNALN